MLQPALVTLPSAFALTAAPLSSTQPGVCQSVIWPPVSISSTSSAPAAVSLCAQAATTLQPCTVGSGSIASSIFSILAPEMSKCSVASGLSGVLCQVAPSSVAASLLTGQDARSFPSDENPTKTAELNMGLDLGNGWKVVGLTSLLDALPRQPAPAPLPTPDPAFVPVSTPVTSSSGSASSLPSSRDCDQWKIVGLTSLNPAVSAGVTETSTAVQPVCLVRPSEPAPSPAPVFSISDASIRPSQSGMQSVGIDSLSSHLALKTSDWKIAGITTLPIPPIPAVSLQTSKTPEVSVNSIANQNSSVTLSTATEVPKWHVVGLTALPAGLPDNPSSLAAPVLPVPLATMATVPSMSGAPADLKPLVGDGGWKVVGLVPLPQGGDMPVHKTTPCPENCSEPSAKVPENDAPLQPKTPHKSVQANVTQRKENKKPHPLSFLPNCSNQFRNAILKKNTVSTMLELKRAYQQKMRREGKLLVRAPSSLNIPLNDPKFVTHHNIQTEVACSMAVETDDKAVLSKHYSSQMVGEVQCEPDMKPNDVCVSVEGPKQEQLSDEKESILGSWQVYNAERGELVMSDSGNSSESVNLTAIDPWGVCTSDDMDDVADMMADKGENRTVQSSSRKRKLSTPRKMVQ